MVSSDRVVLAKSAGFCFGVKRAVDCVYEKLNSGKIYTYGPIIHNKKVTDDLQAHGVEVIESLDDVDTDGEVIIRSHGIPPQVYAALDSHGLKYTDCTCPFVKKIHKIVKKSYEDEQRCIIIVGNRVHPEVVGINGWCNNTAVIINSPEEAVELKTEIDKTKKWALVVQTTFQIDVFNSIMSVLGNGFNDLKLYNTICNATSDRQKEAVEIAKSVDYMVVLGDNKSSNTRKLFEISEKYCKNTFLCESIQDLQLNIFPKDVKIGITAGASTPSVIIKEAVKAMSETKQDFMEMVDSTFVSLRTGQVVKGKVINVSDTGVVNVDLGYKSDGTIARSEFSDDPNVNPAEVVNPGDEISVFVIRVNDGEGNVQLSKKKVDAFKGYEDIEKAYEEKKTITGKVVETVKGGLMILVNGIKVFVPSSQISNRYVEDLSSFIGNEYEFEILEYNTEKARPRIVAGRKALAQKEIDEKKKQVFESIHEGDKINGTVSRIVEFGAFVDLGGVDGLIHISELSWGRVRKVTDVLKEGQAVTVTVLGVDPVKGKISLSLKDADADPWKDAETKYAVGNVVTGKVVRMTGFGAFVELAEGVDGLVHISQIAYKHVEKPEDELTIGQEISAKVTELDLDNKKISLSIKETLPKPEKADEE
jgi:4-hydroxy-3-methylbut-2-enyl diphosphate reductase